jgi:hypothetical protein
MLIGGNLGLEMHSNFITISGNLKERKKEAEMKQKGYRKNSKPKKSNEKAMGNFV